MTPLIQIKNMSFSVGGPTLIDNANLVINPLDKIGLVGRNGTGKSTFLKLLLGIFQPDDGELHLKNGLKMTHEQMAPQLIDLPQAYNLSAQNTMRGLKHRS